jgi:SAM-dependent methyltransferase
VLAPRADERLVDVGCGHGVTVSLVADGLAAGGLVVGVDRSAKVLEMARRRNADHVARGSADFVVGAFESVHLERGVWDTVYAFHVADFWRRPGPMLARARELLRPDGRVVLLNEIASWDRRWSAAAFGEHLAGVLGTAGWRSETPVPGGDDAPGCVAVTGRPPQVG